MVKSRRKQKEKKKKQGKKEKRVREREEREKIVLNDVARSLGLCFSAEIKGHRYNNKRLPPLLIINQLNEASTSASAFKERSSCYDLSF